MKISDWIKNAFTGPFVGPLSAPAKANPTKRIVLDLGELKRYWEDKGGALR